MAGRFIVRGKLSINSGKVPASLELLLQKDKYEAYMSAGAARKDDMPVWAGLNLAQV